MTHLRFPLLHSATLAHTILIMRKIHQRKPGGDDDDSPPPPADPGDSNLGDDIGTKIGEGHDPVEDNAAL